VGKDVSKSYRAVLFDFDDTISDSSEGKRAALIRVAHILKRDTRTALELEKIIEELYTIEEEMNANTSYDRTKWWPEAGKRLGFDVDPATSLRATIGYWTTFTRHQKPFPDAIEVLSELKKRGYSLGMVTDTDGQAGIKRWRVCSSPLFEYFEVVVVAGDDTRRTKPDPKAFVFCAQKLDVNPSEALFVGDKPYTDIKGAKNAGMDAALVNRRGWSKIEGADYIVNSLSEILKILNGSKL
jgi:putative hydrolase of the HAD superfamily